MKYAIVINDLKRLPEAWSKMQEMRKANKQPEKTERISFVKEEPCPA